VFSGHQHENDHAGLIRIPEMGKKDGGLTLPEILPEQVLSFPPEQARGKV